MTASELPNHTAGFRSDFSSSVRVHRRLRKESHTNMVPLLQARQEQLDRERRKCDIIQQNTWHVLIIMGKWLVLF